MFQLAIILFLSLTINAKEISISENLKENDLNEAIEPADFAVISLQPLWILNLNNDELNVRMRAGSAAEIEDYEYMAGPMIKRLQRRPKVTPILKNNNSSVNSKELTKDIGSEDENKQLRKEILKIINKFAMSTDKEPDVYLSENEETNDPTLALYFKGQYTSLIVKLGRKEWHYFIKPPSPLPAWFYEEHINIIREGQEMYVEIPETVKVAFYKSFLHMLQMFLSFPV